jgi:hypothetical protein
MQESEIDASRKRTQHASSFVETGGANEILGKLCPSLVHKAEDIARSRITGVTRFSIEALG